MNEKKQLTRFMNIRSVQSLKNEEIDQVTIPLYKGNNRSELAQQICLTGNLSKADLANRFKPHFIDEEHDVFPPILATYKWLDYKAKPTLEDFKVFVGDELNNHASNFSQEAFVKGWNQIADSVLLLTLFRKLQDIRWIDFQLLIKSCYLIDTFLTLNGSSFKVGGKPGAFIELLSKPIVIPTPKLAKNAKNHIKEFSKLKEIKEVKIDLHVEKKASEKKQEEKQKSKKDKEKDCSCSCDESCQDPSDYCMEIEPYVGDLLILKEELIRYEESDIADIENVLAGELKERKHRSLHRSEDFTEEEVTDTSSEERDNQVTEKDSLQNEVNKTVQGDLNVQAGVVSTASYGTVLSTTVNASAGASVSKTTSDNMARSYSREVVDRSVTNIETKVRTLNSTETITEFEEKNKHTINNDSGDHRAGIYYWVNKVTKAQVYNYGTRMMFDLVIPEPAAIYKKLIKLRRENDLEDRLNAPIKPDVDWEKITRDDYQELMEQYAIVGAPAPPPETTTIDMTAEQHMEEGSSGKTMGFSKNQKSDPIPEGYVGVSFNYNIECYVGTQKLDGGKDETAVAVSADKHELLDEYVNHYDTDNADRKEIKNWNKTGSKTLDNLEGTMNVTIGGFSSLSMGLACSFRITCKLKDEAFQEWQNSIYDMIMSQYNKDLAQFEAQEAETKGLLEIKGQSPFLNRETERNELKRHIIAVLMCDYFNDIGSMKEKVRECGYPEIDFEKLEEQSPLIQFFEQIFEWNYITYLFYHSMWARKCKWPELIEEDSGDPLFDKFLMAGAAKIQLPVRPGLEPLLTWFLESGRPWTGTTMPPYFESNRYISLLEEIKSAKGGDYSDREGVVEVKNGSNEVLLTGSSYYWDYFNNDINSVLLENDLEREILINLKIYKIVDIKQTDSTDETSWTITLDRVYNDDSETDVKHAIGAKYVGAPWEVIVPTQLTYLRNEADTLPTYPLS